MSTYTEPTRQPPANPNYEFERWVESKVFSLCRGILERGRLYDEEGFEQLENYIADNVEHFGGKEAPHE